MYGTHKLSLSIDNSIERGDKGVLEEPWPLVGFDISAFTLDFLALSHSWYQWPSWIGVQHLG